MEYSKFLILHLNYYFLQLILIILSSVWTLKNYKTLQKKNLSSYKKKFLEEINIELTIYILVLFELIYKLIKFSDFRKHNFFISSVISDIITLLIFGFLFYFFEKNPFNLENLFLEEITLLGRAFVLVFRVICLSFEILNLRKICNSCKDVEISGFGLEEEDLEFRVMDKESRFFYKNKKVEFYEEIESLL